MVQKCFTPETFPLQKKRNKGQVPQYYIKDSHPAIIDPEKFTAVQELLKTRADRMPKSEVQEFPLSRKVICESCGSILYRKLSKRGVHWGCGNHLRDKELCNMKTISEDEIYQAFLTLYNKLRDHKDAILVPMLSQLQELRSKTLYAKADLGELNKKISDLVKQNHALSRLQTKGCIDSVIYIERCNSNNQKIEELRSHLRKQQQPDNISETLDNTKELLALFEAHDFPLEFDSVIFKRVVVKITVHHQKLSFHLINGLILEESRCVS